MNPAEAISNGEVPLNLFDLIPACARRILVVGPRHDNLLRSLRVSADMQVEHVSSAEMLEQSGYDAPFDVVVQVGPPAPGSYASLNAVIAPYGRLVMVLLRDNDSPAAASLADHPEIREAATHGWLFYHGREARGQSGAHLLLLGLVRDDYDALAHAAALSEANRPDWAYDILEKIPDEQLARKEVFVSVYAERLLALLAWVKQRPDCAALEHASRAQDLFARLAAVEPQFHAAYQCRAEFWRLTGHPDMAARLLRSVHYAAPSESVQRQLRTLESRRSAPAQMEITPPVWQTGPRPPRLLFIQHPRPHYGLDVLYDGLCEVLGPQNVVDFPEKAWLHGDTPTEMAHYPYSTQWPRHGLKAAEILDQVKSGAFDAVIYGDVEAALDRKFSQELLRANAHVPVGLLDQIDPFLDVRPRVTAYTGRRHFEVYFKREMLSGVDYGERTCPLPFSYSARRAAQTFTEDRPRDLFWAGHRLCGTRRLYLEHLERKLGLDLSSTYTQEEYTRHLRQSRIGINLFGFGFDTVRFWELPAHGCLLLSERLPLHIPYPFEDGRQAVFFDDLHDMESRLAQIMHEPEPALQVARAGHEHFLRFHTARARAEQLLGWLAEYL